MKLCKNFGSWAELKCGNRDSGYETILLVTGLLPWSFAHSS